MTLIGYTMCPTRRARVEVAHARRPAVSRTAIRLAP